MTRMTRIMVLSSLAAGVAVAAMSWSGEMSIKTGAELMSTAEARIGRPMTPMSYAGVARRTTRRAVAVGVGAAAVGGAYVAGSGCVQVANAYGQIVTRCY